MAVDLEDVKEQLRVLDDSEDSALEKLIEDAHDFVERYTGLRLERGETTLAFDSFGAANIRAWPIDASEPITITYMDVAGQQQTLDAATYRVTTSRRPARVVLSQRCPPQACGVEITLTAGFDVLPNSIRRAMLVLISGWYADREGGDVAQAAEKAACNILNKGGFRLRGL